MTLTQVSDVTGLTPELIRMWERRYGFPSPDRTAGGHRRYGRAEVEALHRAALLLRSGYRAGDAVAYARQPEGGIAPSVAAVNESAAWLARELVAGTPSRALSLLRGTELAIGFEPALEQRVLPALRGIGDGWKTGELSVAQEHVATGIVLSWLGSVRATERFAAGRPKVLLATPAGEEHAVAVWALELLLARRGVLALALGSSVPQADLVREMKARRPRALVFAMARSDGVTAVKAAAAAAAALGVTVFAGGPGAVRLPASVVRLPGTLTAGADAIVAALGGRRPRAGRTRKRP
jgi:MerR family transcriptional regulator, light-induced transcriptional regulator